MTWDIVGVGTVTLDEVLTLESFPQEDHKTRVLQRRTRLGGITAAALAAAARLGARCAYAGALGTDAAAPVLRTLLGEAGIDTAACGVDAGARSFQSTILVVPATGSRTILSQPGVLGAVGTLPAARLLLADHHTPAATLTLVGRAQAAGAAVVADIERVTPSSPLLLALADHVILPLAAAQRLTQRDDTDAVLDALWHERRALVAITAGAQGAWWRTAAARGHQPAFPVTAVDTAGCGDVFHGAYAAALVGGAPPVEALRRAAAAAALKAAAADGQSPDAAAVAALLAHAPAATLSR